ncbi:ANTAR domain-containing protein [Streptomyces sp. NPDC048384]|uniref:ANTAR domain-containing protein n=1 Tax=Streptomyces sp. NPDC048384 TaxID=3155487 RepID=UPI00342A2B2C
MERLSAQNQQLHQALASHAVGQIAPWDGLIVLREASQNTNIKLSAVAEHILKHAQRAPLPDVLLMELRTAQS